MGVYEHDESAPPDEEFEPGQPRHIVPGNRGRLLDPRRTPIRIVRVQWPVGRFVVRIEAFEDEGAEWEMAFEDVGRFQFAPDQSEATVEDMQRMHAAIERLDRPLTIPCDPSVRAATDDRLGELRTEAVGWLSRHSSFLRDAGRLPEPDTRVGDQRLWSDLHRWLDLRGLATMEDAFARQFVSNPHAGELVVGHRVVVAELGLVPFEGKVIRDPDLFDGDWHRQRRAEHVLRRLAFVRAVFDALGLPKVRLSRGVSASGPLRPGSNPTFVSATFAEDVARSHFESGGATASRVLWSGMVPVERLFMTYLETAQMNRQFLEAEAVLLHEAGDPPF